MLKNKEVKFFYLYYEFFVLFRIVWVHHYQSYVWELG